MCLLLTLFLGLRANHVGLDMGNYKSFFIKTTNSSFFYLFEHIEFEIGFKMYTKIITLFSRSYSVFIFITAILSMWGVYEFIKENSKNYSASIFIFLTFNYYIYLFCLLRQVLAISFLLLSIKYVKKQKFLFFLPYVLLATAFHKSAIIFLIVYYLPKLKLNKKKITYFCLASFLLFLFKRPIIHIVTVLFYNRYLHFRDTSGQGYTMFFFLLSVLLGIIYLFKDFDIQKKENKILIGMLMICIPLQILATTQGLIARLVLYFSHCLIVLIPNALETLKDKKLQKMLYLLYYILLMWFVSCMIIVEPMYVPYEFL